ncbi:gluconokinase [Aestuariirhabdus sp. Z084]|uniref:gluconokinase n=1 Tax=Aestuariirhabdus haliotis TaxID=2918751 RepID=UPI00201B35CA|nr:gluconokinase [Aestuariirhabdus haliotis]MCL6417382.1 gluconokinase [Aestuariirhabdus haliotis]MCL6421322.1 gluconokinase [Aestuariirhabdus haliotis]
MLTSPYSILVMGTSGSGKSLIGDMLAKRLGVRFIDADDHHSPANVAKMSNLIPLTDDDRADWLATLSGFYQQARDNNQDLVIGCSALKKRYRDQLRLGAPELKIIYLHGDYDLLLERIKGRQGHFFKGDSMLNSQLRDLEIPVDEGAIRLDIGLSAEQLVEHALLSLRANQDASPPP